MNTQNCIANMDDRTKYFGKNIQIFFRVCAISIKTLILRKKSSSGTVRLVIFRW